MCERSAVAQRLGAPVGRTAPGSRLGWPSEVSNTYLHVQVLVCEIHLRGCNQGISKAVNECGRSLARSTSAGYVEHLGR